MSEVNGSTLFPIGKHKGKPLDAVILDRDYCSWFTSQDGLREKYPEIADFLMNGEQDGQETPEHNRIQGRFLDDDFCVRLIRFAYPKVELDGLNYRKFEEHGFDVLIGVGDHEGYKVSSESYLQLHATIPVEIKPAISDDYPRVIRQVRTARKILLESMVAKELAYNSRVNSSNFRRAHGVYSNIIDKTIFSIVYAESVSSAYLSEAQIKKMFDESGIALVTASDVANQ